MKRLELMRIPVQLWGFWHLSMSSGMVLLPPDRAVRGSYRFQPDHRHRRTALCQLVI